MQLYGRLPEAAARRPSLTRYDSNATSTPLPPSLVGDDQLMASSVPWTSSNVLISGLCSIAWSNDVTQLMRCDQRKVECR